MLKRSEALPKVKEWIETNFEEKQGGCVAKRDIFDAYVAFCRANNYQSTNDATFGKIFKTIFPNVQVRRLVRRVKAKKWHYCDVTYRRDSALAEGPTSPSLTDTATTTPPISAATGHGNERKRARPTQRAVSDNDAADTRERKKKRHNEEDDSDDTGEGEKEDALEEDDDASTTTTAGSLVHRSPSSSSSSWSDEDDSSSSTPPTPRQHREEEKDLIHSPTPAEQATARHLPPRRGGDIDLSSSSALSFSSLLHSSSVFPLHSTTSGDGNDRLPEASPFAFGPATKRLNDSSEIGSDAPSLTSSSAEMFFSYQPSSMAEFLKAEPPPREKAAEEPRPPVPTVLDKKEVYPSSSSTSTSGHSQAASQPAHVGVGIRVPAPPALAAAYTSQGAYLPTHTYAPASCNSEPSPFDTNHNLPIHTQAMGSPLHAPPSNHPARSALPTPQPHFPQHLAHYSSYTPSAPIHSSVASANQSSAFLPGQQPHSYHSYPAPSFSSYPPTVPAIQHQHQHQHHHHHQQLPTYATTTAIATTGLPANNVNAAGAAVQTDREMSPESMEIFISHLLTDKSSEVMTLRPQ